MNSYLNSLKLEKKEREKFLKVLKNKYNLSDADRKVFDELVDKISKLHFLCIEVELNPLELSDFYINLRKEKINYLKGEIKDILNLF